MKNYYRTLRQAPPKLEVAKNPTRVSFKMVSCMCDNRSEIKFVKTNDFWKVWSVNASGMGNALSNYGFGGGATSDDLCWLAMEGEWDDIVKIINSGTSAIEVVRSL